MPVKQAATAGPEDAKRAAHMGSPGGAAVLPGKTDSPNSRSGQTAGASLASPCGRTGQTPRQRIQHSRRTDDFPDDFPQRLVRFREVSRMPWAEIARRLGAGPKTVRRWHKHGVRPNAHYLLALQDLAKGRGLGHLFTVRATPYQTVESEGREDSGQGPADRTTGGEQKRRAAWTFPRGTPAAPPEGPAMLCLEQRTHHSIGEATMSPGRCKASSHIWTRGESPRAVRSNLLSTRRRGSDGGSPIASLPELSGSLMERLRGSE